MDENIKMEKPVDGAETPGNVGTAEPAKPDTLTPAFVGFDENGRYFVVKIEVREGYRSILGFLEEAGDWLKFHVHRQQQEMAKQALLKPESGIMGKLNNKWDRLRGK